MGCKDCTKRHVGCHSNCEDYAEQRRQIEETKEKIHKGKDLDRTLNTLAFNRIEYAKKKKGVKK